MDLREMRYIIELSKTKHMTHAANNLFISQPALYKSIRKVETELDTVLFYKRGNELLPTDTGKIVIENAQKILKMASQMEDSITAAKDLKQGEVRFGFTSVVGTMYLPELLVKFQEKYPGIDLHLIEEGGARLKDMTEKGELDIAIVLRPVHSEHLNEIPIIRDQFAVCIPEGHPWSDRDEVTMEDFKNVPFITFNEHFSVYNLIMERFRAANTHPQIAFAGADGQFIYKYTLASGHVAIMPKSMIELYCNNDPINIATFSPSFPWELCLIFPKNIFLSSASKAMITFMQEFLLTKYY